MSPASSRTSAAIQKATFSLVSRRVLGSFWSLQESPLFGGKRGKVEIRGMIFGRTSWKFHSKSVLLKSQNLHLYWKFRKLKYLKKRLFSLGSKWKRAWCNYNRAAESIWRIIRQVMRIPPPFLSRRTPYTTLFD